MAIKRRVHLFFCSLPDLKPSARTSLCLPPTPDTMYSHASMISRAAAHHSSGSAAAMFAAPSRRAFIALAVSPSASSAHSARSLSVLASRPHHLAPWSRSAHGPLSRSQASVAAPEPGQRPQIHPPSPPSPLPPANDSDLDHSYVGLTGGQIVHELLRKHQVKHVFGYPGGAILPVFDAIYNSPHFEFILPRHEQGGGHMAQGYARATGKPGVVIVTSGPGATNVVTPLQDALSDGTPMVVFSGQVPNAAIGSDAFQECDATGITRSCTKWNVMVKDVSELPRRITEAFAIATSGRPGPVLVDLPKDVTASVLRKPIPRVPDVPRFPGRPPSFLSPHYYDAETAQPSPGLKATLAKVADAINHAKRPLLKQLAEKAQIPVTTTLQALGAFDEHSPLSLHMLGMHGSAYANMAMQQADVMIALGARFDDRVTGNLAKFAPAARKAEKEGKGGIYHFEILPKNINKTVQVTDATKRPEDADRKPWLADVAKWKAEFPFSYPANVSGEPMKPQYVLDVLNTKTRDFKDKVVLTTGVGQHQMWAAQYYRWTHPLTMITSGGLGTMGFGCPRHWRQSGPGKDTLVIDFKIGVKVLLLNNDFQGMVRQWQDLFYDQRYAGTEMCNPDFVKLAEAFGVKGLRAETPEELDAKMDEFLKYNDGPVLLEARVCKKEHVYPMVPAGKALDEMVLGPPTKEDK
ncbi:Thiamin diphosphate-binding protein [Catenaria anguillulae PL171]|uniref:Thiamin diphosphate-binding protein n=1 Tax=Catenaria anguillulae PL171 TaxID=765915 RepID=A0A1Y2I6S9_9FUNG|nr:Thiamin diphosphate-binding protein [Catenaria anguillulae PL171]